MRPIKNLAGNGGTPAEKPLSKNEFKQQLLATGLMSGLPLPADHTPRPEVQPAVIEGEPLSETIIRERS